MTSSHPHMLTSREILRVSRVYAQRYTRDPKLPRAVYLERLAVITQELYPGSRYPGTPIITPTK